MSRARQFDERQVLIAAMLVFWEKGYDGTSIQDLEQAMGLNRTSIYNAFGNKRELFERVVSCYKESVMGALFEALDSAPDIRTGIRRMLEQALEIHFSDEYPGGCLVVLSVLESGQHDEQSHAILANTIRELKQALQSRLAAARKKGELPPGLDAGSMSTTIATTMAGMMVLGQADFSRNALKKTINQVLQLLDQAE